MDNEDCFNVTGCEHFKTNTHRLLLYNKTNYHEKKIYQPYIACRDAGCIKHRLRPKAHGTTAAAGSTTCTVTNKPFILK